jgi:phytoene dehydrogenase-like protein
MIVIGGGIGGMIVAATCRNVTLFEMSPVLGGRFRNINVRGFTLTTGALHMIPHAEGILPQLLRSAGVEFTIIKSEPAGTFMLDREYKLSDLFSHVGILGGISLSRMLLDMKTQRAPECSIEDYMRNRINDTTVLSLLSSFCGWSLSMRPRDVPAQEFFLILRAIMAYGGPGVPQGGCSALIDAMRKECERKNNKIIHKKVRKIIVEENRVRGVVDEDGICHEDTIVVSDIGAKGTSKLCEFPPEYKNMIEAQSPSCGIKISVATRDSLISHSGVLFTPACERICGANQVTNADPILAPKGWHLVMTHQPMLSDNVKSEAELGLADIEALFGDRKYEILAVQPFKGDYPVNRAASGFDFDQRTPIEGLYLVGDCAKVPGGMEVEGIARGVKRVVENYLCDMTI